MIKLVLDSKNKIIKLQKHNFEQLRQQIKHTFPEAPIDYILSYLDSDKDEICLNSDEDLSVMLSTGLKINKVYIKQSFSQTIDISYLTEEIKIQPHVEVYNSDLKSQAKVQISQTNDSQKQQVKQQEISKEEPLKIDVPEKIKIQKEILIDQPYVQKQKVVAIIHSDIELSSNEDQKDKQQDKQQDKHQDKQQTHIKEQIYANPYIQIEETKKEQSQVEVKVEQKDKKQKQIKVEPVVVIAAEKSIKNVIEKQVKISNIQAEQVKKDSELSPSKFFIDNAERQFNLAYFQQKNKIQKQAKLKQIKQLPKQLKPKNQFPFPRQYLQQFKVLIPQPKQVELIYHNVICYSCKDEYGIIGIRYQCILCDNFNICEACEAKVDHPHSLLQVKKADKFMKKEQIIQKYKKQIFAPVERPIIPLGNYVPSISKQQAHRLINQAQTQIKTGYERSQKYLDDLFMKIQMHHANPYEMFKGQPVSVNESNEQKARYIYNTMGGNFNQILHFCKMYNTCTKQQILNIYINSKKLSN